MAARERISAGGSDRGSGEAAGPAEQSAVVLTAIRRLLRPIVRWLISHQVTFPMLSALLKEVYVAVAERDFPLAEGSEKRPTDSRITLMTGVHRKDVARLRAGVESESPQASASLGAQLVGRWLADPSCTDERGRALPLPRKHNPESPDDPSFEALVRSVSTDIRPRAVLDEWLRMGIAELDDADRVNLRHDAFVPEAGFGEKSHFLSWNAHDHLAAAFENLSRGEGREDTAAGDAGTGAAEPAPFLERAVFYAHLRPESVAELAGIAREHGIEALKAVNRRAAELQARDQGHPEARQRMRFGSYFYSAEIAEIPETAEPSQALERGGEAQQPHAASPGAVAELDNAPNDAPHDANRDARRRETS